MADVRFEVRPIGYVRSPLTDPDLAPRQGDEGSPQAWLVIDPTLRIGIGNLRVGEVVLVLTWLHRARRDSLATHPRNDPDRPEVGVFSTRSPHRPNPIGLHRVRIVSIDDTAIGVQDLEAVDGTPVVDIKPVLGPLDER